jgi:hypothetical protein
VAEEIKEALSFLLGYLGLPPPMEYAKELH